MTFLFLVDGDLLRDTRRQPGIEPTRLSAQFPWDEHGNAVPVPQLYSDENFSPFAILKNFFTHEWHLKTLCAPLDLVAIRGEVFAYMLAATSYQSNLSWLDNEVKTMAFADIREPSIKLNNRLHDRRYDLNTLQTEVQWANKWKPRWIEQYCLDTLGEMTLRSPGKVLDEVMSDSEYLDKFLMDTFQLVMSSINILDFAASIEQAKRGTLLTQLAAIYLPLSLVTGIFGMNVRGISDAPAWSCAVALVLLIPLTLALLLVMKHVPSLDPGRQSSAKDGAKGDQARVKFSISMAGFRRRLKDSDARSV